MKPIHLFSLFAVLLGSVLPLPAADPAWWLGGSPPVIDPAAQPENRAIASIGQAKWMAKNALESLRTILPETAALVEADLVGSGKPIATWAAPITAQEKQAQLSPLLVGQLKAISAPFYQHLQAAAPLWLTSEMAAYQLPPGSVPWTAATVDDSNLSPTVIGQLKAVFSFDFAADRESGENIDGISDLWEYTTFNSLLTVTSLNAGTYIFEDAPSDTGQDSIDPSALDEEIFDPNLEDFDDEPTTHVTRSGGETAPAPVSLADFTPSQRKARADTLGISSSILSNTRGCWTFEGRMAGTASFPMIYRDYSGRGNHATNWNQDANQKLGMPSYATKFGGGKLSIPAKVLENQQSFSLSTWVKFPVSLQVEAESLTRIDDMKPLFSFYQTIPKTTPTSPPLGKGRIFALRKTNGAPNWFIGGYEQTENYLRNAVTNFTGDYFTMPGIDDGRWHHLAVTYATSSYGQEIWLDGKLLKSFPLKNEYYVDFSHPDTQINFGSLPPGRNSFSFSQVHLDRLRLHSGKLSSDQIQSLHQQDIDGDGVWDITETATRYTYGNNLTAFLSSPYITNAPNSDTDDDGLKDLIEQNLGTRMDSPDTDGDGLLDGWEYKYRALGLDPFKKNKVGADIDGDGLDWLEEYARATHPGKKDTDGDGQNDKIDPTPNDPTNPPASARFSVLLGIGDKSGSLSENYDLNVYERNPQTGAETRVFTLTSGGHGKYKEETKDSFIRGRSYTFQIDWQSTNGKPQTNAAGTVIDGADFDYTFKVQPQGNTGAVLIDSFSPTDPAATTIQLLSASASDVVQSKSEFVQKYESRRVGLLPVEVKEVWSDQITGVETNGFPDKTGPNEYPYIFMGASSATTFKVKIKLAAEIPAAVRSQILFRWASEGILGEFLPETGTSTFSDGTTVQLSSNFNINVGRERFLVWAFDETKNGQIDGSESETLIKMPHIRRGVSTSIPCKFIPIAQADYQDSKETLLDWASFQLLQNTLRNSARHLTAFCNGEVPTYAGSEPTTIKRNEPGLTHPVGVAFTPTSNPGVSFKATISKDHDLSIKLIESNALRSWLAGEFNSVAEGIRADIIQERGNGNPAALLSYSIAAREKSLAFGIIDPDLLLFLGKVTFGNPTIDFDVDMYGFVSDVKVSGLANDLYDFDHEGEELLAYPARKASEVQAGFPSLGSGGKVFKTQIDLGGGNPYSNPDLRPYTFFPY